ncbi:MAG: glycosyltransferase family 2 protein [Xenococcaceae cyanobacterium MO_234.B1]|nr:glycosyltransferase family 2 protein [Xenococcaceae cyanobacterium MO_234.B1]
MKDSLHRNIPYSYLDNILVIIPVRNEAATIGTVISSLQSYGLKQIRVVDNGSSDRSAIIATEHGAEVVTENIPGYGQACWRGLQNIPSEIEWILFCDGDGSDDLSCLPQFFQLRENYDLILGDRSATPQGKAVMTPVQNFGNSLAGFLINLGWGHRYQDLGPLRLIRRSALEKIGMCDRGMGWTVEMQVKAVECNLNICEIPVGYRPRQGGKSKISGTISGSVKAGIIILATLGNLYLKKLKLPDLSYLSGILLVLGSISLIPFGDFRNPEVFSYFWLGMGIMSIGFILSWGVKSISAWWFWLVAIAARLLLLPMYPGNDIWRYIWEGLIQLQGFSPYDFAPNATELIPYRTEWWQQINHQHVSAIYPPVAQLGFRWLAAIAPHFLLFKSAFVAADLLTCWLLTQKFSYQQTLIYAWNPLVIYSFAGGGHYDSWFILPLVSAWLLFDYHKTSTHTYCQSSLLLSISIAVKWISFPFLGFLAWQAWQKINFKIALLVIICGILPFFLTALPFCNTNSCHLIPTSSTFVSHGRSAEFLPHILSKFWKESLKSNAYFALPLGLISLFLILKSFNLQQFGSRFFLALLTISPIIHGWYFTWIIPFAVPTQNLGIRLLSLSSLVYFALPYHQAVGDRNWDLTDLETMVLWLPFILGYCITISHRKLEV